MGFDVPETGPLPKAPSMVGQVLDGRYKIVKLIGEGGMGEVYAAEHVHIEKRYAIKLLKAEIVSNQEAVQRFRQEARSSSSIGHRNIIAIEDFGQLADGRIYMCMELLNGQPLNDMIQQPVPYDRLLNILIQTGHGLAAAHAKGIIHRDMKPENIFVTVGPNGEDVPKLLDFGIAKVTGSDGQNHLTRTGTIFGTPFYMAPEQALGNPVDARTDIYSVGVIMYECFSGSLPFQGESFMGILTQHITTEPEPVAQRAAKAGRSLPPGLAEIIARAMAKNPAQRFATMDELVSALVALYRSIAGAGMSTYMEAFPVGHVPAPTPTPAQYAGPPSAPVAAIAPSGSQPMVMPPSGMYPASASASVPMPANKSKLGIVIAILAVLAVAGGVVAFVLLGSDDKKQDQKADDGSGSAVVVVANGSAEPKVPVDDHAPGTVVDHGSATPTKHDPWGDDSAEHRGSQTTVVLPPRPKQVDVLVMTKPALDSFEIWEGGKKIADGPNNLKIEVGSRHDYTLKAKGFKDAPVVIDGMKERVIVKIARLPGHPPPPPPPPPPPNRLNCTTRIIDPHDHRCVTQYCNLHEDEPRCQVE